MKCLKRHALLLLVATTFSGRDLTSAVPAPQPQATASVQRFVCNTGYTIEKCRTDIAVLRKTLAKFPVAGFGAWTWVLVKSEDWKSIVVPRGLSPDSPAFTYYEKRETFIEEALVAEIPGRRRDLLLKWHMSMQNLLDFAVAHELGHALCNEKDEQKANRVAKMLRQGQPFVCGT